MNACKKTGDTTDDVINTSHDSCMHKDEPKARKIYVTDKEIRANSITNQEYLESYDSVKSQPHMMAPRNPCLQEH
ncbi:MAG: hypothetical protein K2X93_15825 [Candidatus Obscuribacterales bacterium]|nr:hypothetical protein [Candidatus Obscuribacterales bacterium]